MADRSVRDRLELRRLEGTRGRAVRVEAARDVCADAELAAADVAAAARLAALRPHPHARGAWTSEERVPDLSGAHRVARRRAELTQPLPSAQGHCASAAVACGVRFQPPPATSSVVP